MTTITQNTSTMKLGGVLFLLFFFIYSINFTFLPIHTSQIISLGVVLFAGVQILTDRDFEFNIDNGIKLVFTIWIFYTLWVFLRSTLTEFRDIAILYNSFLIFFQVFIGSLFFAWWFMKSGYSFKTLLRMIQILIVIQAIFIIIYFFSWDFKEFTLLFIPEGGNLSALHPFRSRGLTHQAGADLAAFQGMGLLITAYIIVKSNSWKTILPDVAAMLLIVGSVLLTGRTGLLIIPFVLVFFAVYMIHKQLLSKKLIMVVLLFPLFVLGGYFLIQYIVQHFGFMGQVGVDYDIFDALNRWLFGEVEQFADTGRTRTMDILITDHLFFPESLGVFLFGDPTTHTLNRVPSDIGFVRWIFGTGLVGLMLLYMMVISIFIKCYIASDQFAQKLFILLFGVWIFILELKEPFLTNFRFASLYLILFSYLCVMPLQNWNRVRLQDID